MDWVPTGGTLLGAIRDGDIVGKDHDADLLVRLGADLVFPADSDRNNNIPADSDRNINKPNNNILGASGADSLRSGGGSSTRSGDSHRSGGGSSTRGGGDLYTSDSAGKKHGHNTSPLLRESGGSYDDNTNSNRTTPTNLEAQERAYVRCLLHILPRDIGVSINTMEPRSRDDGNGTIGLGVGVDEFQFHL
jgi:hypothetical protein